MKSLFITLEGVEGSGKSTQIQNIAAFCRKHKRPCMVVREPGGTVISEKVREILLEKKHTMMSAETELLLYCAARAQIVREVIQPALKRGVTVICDRFYDSTVAYQGFGLGMAMNDVKRLCAFATGGLVPDVTFVLDVPIAIGLKRAGRTDRIEARSRQYHNRVRRGFLAIAKKERRRCVVIDGTQARDVVRTEIEKRLQGLI